MIGSVWRDGTRADMIFAAGTTPGQVRFPEPLSPRVQRLGGTLRFQVEASGPIRFHLAGTQVEITPALPEPGLFRGENTGFALRNGEDPATVLDWLTFHQKYHGMTAALILDRAAPGEDEGFGAALEEALAEHPSAPKTVLLHSEVPLGRPDLPAEAHPFCIPEAPGKDRMELPPPDPQRAPLHAPWLYELLRHRFFAEARAVLHLDVCDLLPPTPARLCSTRACAAPDGIVPLAGRPVHPWRIRKGQPACFGDHVCTPFDSWAERRRWCAAPGLIPEDTTWRALKIGDAPPASEPFRFYRCMALRHPTGNIARIVPKSSLVIHPPMVRIAEDHFGWKPVFPPELRPDSNASKGTRRAIVTTMKNEGPFLLEWLAHHRAIGFDDILVYTNDCTDGTDAFFGLLDRKGLVHHRDNPYRETGLKPQHAALRAAESEPVIREAAWITCIDVDEYINIHAGDGTLDALFGACPDANMIAMTWRLFGNADIHGFEDALVTRQFRRAAPQYARKPHQAWGFKTLFRNLGLFRKLGVHRPKGLNPQLVDDIRWVNGSGNPMPPHMYRNAWRSTTSTYGYDLVTLNHYAVRSAESFLVKRDRGRVNHVDRDQGIAYWFRMNNNAGEELSIQRRLPAVETEFARLIADPEIRAAHEACVIRHRQRIAELKTRPDYARLYAELTSPRMEQLSRLHAHFGANVFLAGPESIPDAVADRTPEEEFFFTVPYAGGQG